MKNRCLLLLGLLVASSTATAGAEDDPVLAKLMIDKLEWRAADGPNPWVWDADAWVGRDLNKLWIKTEGERADGHTESAYGELLYSRAVAPYWDLQLGWRHDFRPEPDRDWVAVGFKGLAPYWFEVDATLYAGGNGTVAGRLDAEYELMLSQRLILSPELELVCPQDVLDVAAVHSRVEAVDHLAVVAVVNAFLDLTPVQHQHHRCRARPVLP